jgi:hypothetical protein
MHDGVAGNGISFKTHQTHWLKGAHALAERFVTALCWRLTCESAKSVRSATPGTLGYLASHVSAMQTKYLHQLTNTVLDQAIQ